MINTDTPKQWQLDFEARMEQFDMCPDSLPPESWEVMFHREAVMVMFDAPCKCDKCGGTDKMVFICHPHEPWRKVWNKRPRHK